jgi:hypothetical protein
MLRIIVDHPCSMRTGHDVQVVEIVAVGGTNRVVAARHHYNVAILYAQRFVEIAQPGIDALEPKTL